MAERDYIAAVRDHVVVFDGGMGATLEQFDLTSEDYGGVPGKGHQAVVLKPPEVTEGGHPPMGGAGGRAGRDPTLPAPPPERPPGGVGRATAPPQHEARGG